MNGAGAFLAGMGLIIGIVGLMKSKTPGGGTGRSEGIGLLIAGIAMFGFGAFAHASWDACY